MDKILFLWLVISTSCLVHCTSILINSMIYIHVWYMYVYLNIHRSTKLYLIHEIEIWDLVERVFHIFFLFIGAFNLAQALSNRPSKSAKEKLVDARFEQKELSEVHSNDKHAWTLLCILYWYILIHYMYMYINYSEKISEHSCIWSEKNYLHFLWIIIERVLKFSKTVVYWNKKLSL